MNEIQFYKVAPKVQRPTSSKWNWLRDAAMTLKPNGDVAFRVKLPNKREANSAQSAIKAVGPGGKKIIVPPAEYIFRTSAEPVNSANGEYWLSVWIELK